MKHVSRQRMVRLLTPVSGYVDGYRYVMAKDAYGFVKNRQAKPTTIGKFKFFYTIEWFKFEILNDHPYKSLLERYSISGPCAEDKFTFLDQDEYLLILLSREYEEKVEEELIYVR